MHKTKDYSIFKIREDNRPIEKAHVKKLIESIDKKNLLETNPIIVNTELEVIDGQHRLEAAKFLKIPVYYQIIHNYDIHDMRLLNVSKSWGLKEHFEFYCKNEFPEYLNLKEFIEKNKLSLSIAMKITNTELRKGMALFKEGKYIFNNNKSEDLINKINETIEMLTEFNGKKNYTNCRNFWSIAIQVFSHPDFIYEKWKFNLARNMTLFSPRASLIEYLHLFLRVYNWKNHAHKIEIKGSGFDY
jgi:hypothetical protein